MEPASRSSRSGRPVVALTVFLVLFLVSLATSAADTLVANPSKAVAQEVDLESPADPTADFQPPDVACPPGSLPAPPPPDAGPDGEQSTECVPVVDRRTAALTPSALQEPDGHFAQAEAAGAMSGSEPLPDPGIFDAGTMYLDGTLRVTYSATFRSYVEVYPEYTADEFDDPLLVSGYYITATNRTERGVEFLARFRESILNDPSAEKGWFMIFDWSCLPDWPCQNEAGELKYGFSFVRDWRMDEVPCWYRMLEDNTGRYVNYAYFRNSTWIVEPRNPPADPPLWRNAVSVWNYCTNQYDGIYSHDYASNQTDCSLPDDGNPGTNEGCGDWAGVAERFPDNSSKPPVIAKQGFHQQTLDYDGQSTRLRPENSWFKDPSVIEPPYWQLYYLSSNDTWEAGTYQDDDGDDVPNASDPDIDGDGVLNGDEIACGATAPPGYTPDAHPYRRPERIDGPFAGVDDDGDTQIDEALPGGASAYDCDGDGYKGLAEDHVFSYKPQVTGDQKRCGEYDTSHPNPWAKPSLRWPADLSPNIVVDKINISDLSAYVGVPRYYSTNVGTNPGDVRFDVVPGTGAVPGTQINISDLQSVALGTAPMLGGVRVYNGPPCPW